MSATIPPRVFRAPSTLAVAEDSDDSIAVRHPWSWQRMGMLGYRLGVTAAPIWLADMLAVLTVSSVAFLVISLWNPDLQAMLRLHSLTWLVATSGAFLVCGLYPAIGVSWATEVRLLTRIVLGICATCLTYSTIHGDSNWGHAALWLSMAGGLLLLLPLYRTIARAFAAPFRGWGIPVYVIGCGPEAQRIWKLLEARPTCGLRPVGFLEDRRRYWRPELDQNDSRVIGFIEDAAERSALDGVPWAVFAINNCSAAERHRLVDDLSGIFSQLFVLTDCAEVGRQWTGTLELGSTRLLKLSCRLLRPGNRSLKRALDIALVLAASPFVLLLVYTLAAIVRGTSPGPAFYTHYRVGRFGRAIRVWKLRSMVKNADEVLADYLERNPAAREEWNRSHKLANDPRITWIGKIIRRTSLDELPQLWNVLQGDMSLVGPRPIFKHDLVKYREVLPLYVRLRPGLTGLWQVNGRSLTTFEDRMAYDAEYARNWSIWLDLQIILQTFRVVVRGDGAY